MFLQIICTGKLYAYIGRRWVLEMKLLLKKAFEKKHADSYECIMTQMIMTQKIREKSVGVTKSIHSQFSK